jgi:hypothetical protein
MNDLPRRAELPRHDSILAASGCIALVARCLCLGVLCRGASLSAVEVDVSGVRSDGLVRIVADPESASISWPDGAGRHGRLELRFGDGALVRAFGVSEKPDGVFEPILEDVDPVFFLTVGSREVPPGKPADQRWGVFFDNPAIRPHTSHAATLDPRRVIVTTTARTGTLRISSVSVGSFSGELEFRVWAGSSLVRVAAIVATAEDKRAIIYDAGLAGAGLGACSFAHVDSSGRFVRAGEPPVGAETRREVRHRAIIAERKSRGSVALFPPPHQFQFPRDWTDNLGFVWIGSRHRGLEPRLGFGIQQAESGGGPFVPWWNAPPGERHRLTFFLEVSSGDAESAMARLLRYSRGDRFAEIPGHKTLTSHFHMAIAIRAMEEKKTGIDPRPIPEYATMFRAMGVDLVHLADFHGDGHQRDPGPLRLPELEALFDECRRLSDEDLLLIPGEEVNTFLGLEEPGKHPGHWMSLFPRPVYWTLQRGADEPFVEPHEKFGKRYRVGSRADMLRLLEVERGLAWTAHPRIKASSWTPDIFRHEDFYLSDTWLGAAWKAMPGDLSRPTLGWRPLAVLSDMANWGQRKYLVGEVDVFKLSSTHELWGHMNINYLRIDSVPRFDDGWEPVLDALRGGRFFVSTGELLIHDFSVAGAKSGDIVRAPRVEGVQAVQTLRFDVEWTFPPAFALIVSGDGVRTYEERIELEDSEEFGRREIVSQQDLRGKRWIRAEVWDVAANGAFTQPVWIEGEPAEAEK